VADTIRKASSVPEGNDASPLPLVVGAAETAGRTLPVGSEAGVRGFGVIGMLLLAVGVDVITGIGAWLTYGAGSRRPNSLATGDTANRHQPSAAFKAVTINRSFATSRHRRTRLVLEP
jgi:hypothetical protein